MPVREPLTPLLEQPGTDERLSKRAAKALDRAHKSLRPLVRQQLVERLCEWLGVDASDFVLEALDNWDELREHAAATRTPEAVEDAVGLPPLQFEAARTATVDVVVDGLKLAELPLRLDVRLAFDKVVARVEDGCLTAISSGTCKLTATLLVDGVEVSRWAKPLDLGATLTCDPPIALCRPEPQQTITLDREQARITEEPTRLS